MSKRRLFPLFLLILQGCMGRDIGPTIADMEPRSIEMEPAVSFDMNRDQVIESYRNLTSITPESGLYAQVEQRLADLELEASLDKQLSEDPNTIEDGRQQALLAISRYENYLHLYPNQPDNDLILYQLSRAYAFLSQTDKAQQALDQLVERYPDSRYIDEIQFRRGENYFVDGRYADAEKAYGIVVERYPQSIFYEKSLYKYGWTLFKQNQNRAGLKSFIRLMDRKQQQGMLDEIQLEPDLARAEKELIEDVLRVISLSFSYLPDRQPISQFFNREGHREYEPLLYKNLGELYLDKERVTDATDTYLAFGDNFPFSPHRHVFHGMTIETYKKAGFSSLLLPEKQRFVEQYNVDTEYWLQQDEETHAQLQPVLTEHLTDVATHYHALARASKKPADYRLSAQWYQRFLDSFPNNLKAAEINFLLAEVRYDSGQYQMAVVEYEKTAYQYPDHENSAEAGYSALIAYNKLVTKAADKQKPVINQQLIQSSLRFADTFPNDKRMPSVLMKTTEQYYDSKQYADSLIIAQRLIDYPQVDPQIRHQAWIIAAHSEFELTLYAEAEYSYTQVLKGLPKKHKQRKEFQEQLAASIYRQGELARSQQQHQLAAEHFLRVGKRVPTSPTRVVADYDAATEYLTLEQWPTAITLLETFRKKYPKQKKWSLGVSQKLALAYSKSGQKQKSAGEMMRMVKLSPESERGEIQLQAAALYKESGQQARAIDIYQSYVGKNPDPVSRSIELKKEIADFYASKKNVKKQRYWLNEIVKADTGAGKERSPRTRYLAATSSLELIRPLHRRFENTKLTIPLKKSLKKKKDLMKKSIDAYTRAAKYQIDEVTTAATFNIAEIYRNFATSLMNSERPKNLNEEELEEYDYLLEDQAFPFEEKAISIHQNNVAKIPKGSYDEHTKGSLKALGKLMPFRYAKQEVTETYAEN